MFRYLGGLLLVQLVTVGLFALNADADPRALVLGAGVPALAVAVLAALWFRTLSRADGERDLARTRLEHERERERLGRAAERERVDIVRTAERTVRREERRTARRANLKVGLAFAGTAGMGVLFVVSELVTLGLLTMTAGGGALGGYLLRWRQTRTLARGDGHPRTMADATVVAGRDVAPDESPERVAAPAPAFDETRTPPVAESEPLALPAPVRTEAKGPDEPAGSSDARSVSRRRRSMPGRARV